MFLIRFIPYHISIIYYMIPSPHYIISNFVYKKY